jgi:hypothetical protein
MCVERLLDQRRHRSKGSILFLILLIRIGFVHTTSAAFTDHASLLRVHSPQKSRKFRSTVSYLSMTTTSSSPMTPPERLQNLLDAEMNGRRTHTDAPILLPCCYDGLTARLIARSNYFEATFMTGFGASAAHGFPDTQLISFHEMMETCRVVGSALSNVAQEIHTDPIPCIAVRNDIACFVSLLHCTVLDELFS